MINDITPAANFLNFSSPLTLKSLVPFEQQWSGVTIEDFGVIEGVSSYQVAVFQGFRKMLAGADRHQLHSHCHTSFVNLFIPVGTNLPKGVKFKLIFQKKLIVK